MLINPNKKYSKLVSIGCSYTDGFNQEEKAQWGRYLAGHLNCEYENMARNSSSNFYIYNKVLNYCEREQDNDYCLAIQWSEFSRRELYIDSINDYIAFNLATLYLNDTFEYQELNYLKDNYHILENIFFRENDMIWRSYSSMISCMSYLRNKNIDFIMFQGINSIMDFDTESNTHFPLTKELKQNLLNQPEFFNEFGDMHNHMFTHELFNEDNDRHPNSEYIQWWAKQMYDYIIKNNT